MKRILACIICLCFCIPLSAQDAAAPVDSAASADLAAPVDSVAVYLAQGDQLAGQWKHAEAAHAYLAALRLKPDCYEAAWKAGDELTEYADSLPAKDKAGKEAAFAKAGKLCETAIRINPSGWEGHFRLSVALGRLALFRGGKEKINLSKRIKVQADSAVILNPQADLAYHVLGRWHQNLANLSSVLRLFAKVLYGGVPPGSNDEAVAMFKKAIEINPNHIEHYLELARTYEFMGKEELMSEPLNKVLALPNVEEDDPVFKKEAEEMLKELD
jgi:tetratricopeptide (TPR) repeat protein